MLAAAAASASASRAATYEVGPGQPLAAVGDVPWESLAPGDEVRIHWRAEPYREKFVVAVQGTAERPVVIRGIPNERGEPPVIDGRDATTRAALDFWNENRGVIKIGGANTPDCDAPDCVPSWITIEGLDVRSARPPYAFSSARGGGDYADNAAAIYVEVGRRITIRNCRIHDSGNGLFIGAYDGLTEDILVEGNWIYDNGIEGSIYEHNSYTAARGITFQFNHYGSLRAGCGGNNLKDRSAGLVVRYNWIENGNRQLDLVDGEDTAEIPGDPRYRTTFVYGNVLVEGPDEGNSQIVHYGGDSGDESLYRKGTLYFHNNTVVSTRDGNTTLFRLSTNDERCDARNNVFYVSAPGDRLALCSGTGRLDLSHNWFKPGFVATHDTLEGTIGDDGTAVTGDDPGFVDRIAQDFHLAAGSPCIDAGTDLAAAVLPDHDVLFQYVAHQAGEPRPLEPPF
ncbi:MAG: polysaccharide-degrading enzyme, partial [Myxococcales bacterium]|nr:polysaccharide-degrading enzyme [Myxococcales bacterium]